MRFALVYVTIRQSFAKTLYPLTRHIHDAFVVFVVDYECMTVTISACTKASLSLFIYQCTRQFYSIKLTPPPSPLSARILSLSANFSTNAVVFVVRAYFFHCLVHSFLIYHVFLPFSSLYLYTDMTNVFLLTYHSKYYEERRKKTAIDGAIMLLSSVRFLVTLTAF